MRFILIVVALLVAPMAWAGPPLDDDDSPGLGNLAGLGSSQDGPESTVIVVTDKGTQFSAGPTTCTESGVTVATGSTVIVAVFYIPATVAGATATWNGQALTLDDPEESAFGCSVFSKHNVTGATGDVVVTITGGSFAIVMSTTEVSGLSSSATDKVASAFGSGDSPSSGNTAATSQADELLFGVVGAQNSDSPGPIGGTWSGSFTSLQDINDVGAEVALSTGYRIVTATGAYAAAKTGASADNNWSAIIATYKKAP